MLDSYLPLARRLLEQTELTHRVAAATLDDLLAASSIQRHPPGRTFSMRGQPMANLLFVLEGSLEVSMEGSDGRRSIVWYLAPGQWMGLIPILDGKGAIHNLRAHTEAVLLHVPRATFQAALQADQSLALMCLDVLCERSRSIYDNMASETLLPLRARVARLLLLLLEQHGRDAVTGIELALKLSQDEFAAMLGVTRQSLNRELKALEKMAVLSISYSRITLQDLPALQALAGVAA
ncbi:Crp/Fnr family transcriptional regulator [Pseudomonas sp. N040]|uniref:Crp/Fnr family transcriptional regulator n=1 Tax=Pseudomonas sp. N040 TaxID=2785325 RepID=UPI0018A312D3|nr:Crp/Fnr family transcriptional regulator [Pseudomonas sp. N040]MBF7729081.1 Crp/Fnr family transcriptional regulator [Pseudomonas sp. N040]MBW7012721.1 Crp/Fnr family transcriptional regulator [Pseudomonas sp. N040]